MNAFHLYPRYQSIIIVVTEVVTHIIPLDICFCIYTLNLFYLCFFCVLARMSQLTSNPLLTHSDFCCMIFKLYFQMIVKFVLAGNDACHLMSKDGEYIIHTVNFRLINFLFAFIHIFFA